MVVRVVHHKLSSLDVLVFASSRDLLACFEAPKTHIECYHEYMESSVESRMLEPEL